MGVYERVIEKYGKKHQLNKAIEELDELKDEILKELDGNGDMACLVSELADVSNMLRQLQIIFGISHLHLDFEMGRKMGLALRNEGNECNKCMYGVRNDGKKSDCTICDFKGDK